MANKIPDLYLSLSAFALYITGGLGIFGGIALIILMNGQDLFGWGDAKTIGYLLLCIGVCFSIMGVLFIRLVRNRTNTLLSQYSKSSENS